MVGKGVMWVKSDDQEQSWLRMLITVSIDWRLVIAVLLLVLVLLYR
jgi:hypothetical protein